MSYRPRPADTSRVELPAPLWALMEELARNNHEVWAQGRLAEGWTWGPTRDDAKKTHPSLVPYDDLPESEKQYDRNAASETLRLIGSLGWTVAPPEGAVDAGSPEPHRARAAALRRQGEPLGAYDALVEGLARWPADVRLRQLQATVLADLGCPLEARAAVDALMAEGATDEETLGIVGRVYKDLALASREPARRRLLRRALDAYRQAFEQTGGYWTGINAATVAVLCGRRRDAEAIAQRVERTCASRLDAAPSAEERYWLLATLAEAALVQGRLDEACRRYVQAAAFAHDDFRSIAGSRRNARLLAAQLDLPWGPLAAAFPLPHVVVFSGHMVDAPDRGRPRFPPALEPAVRAAIEAQVDRLGPAVCYAAAACGSDLLFLEAALHRGHQVVVVLPYDAAGFRRDSVELCPGAGWGERFDAVLARAHVVPPVSNQRSTWGGAYYDFANQVLLGLAMLRAQQLDTSVVGLTVWDGRVGDGPGGTAATVDLWRRFGVPVEWIDLDGVLRGVPARRRLPAPKRTARPRRKDGARVRVLLFADVKDFSKMPEEIVEPFVTHALGIAGRLVRRRDLAPIGREPRGDGFQLVFASARAAGRFAVALSERLAAMNWVKHHLPATLVMRIGLHAGIVYRLRDPVADRLVHVGTHINRAARIEPVTPPGQVWASQEFAALAALERVREFACEYVGQVELAKGYGVFPLYRLRSRGTGEASVRRSPRHLA